MTKFDANWKAEMEAKRAYMAEHGMYREEDEHSSCGVGQVVSIDGKKSRKVVENGIAALKAIWHRGAVDADGKTGDGACTFTTLRWIPCKPIPEIRLNIPGKNSATIARDRPTASKFKPPR